MAKLDNDDKAMSEITADDEADLVRLCTEAKRNSHSPYSKFPVGSAVLIDHKEEGKKIYKGCNIENCAYPLSTCAERVAITKAVSEGFNKSTDKLLAVAVTSDLKDQFCVPCGGCRQVIAEFGYANNCLVLLVKPSGESKRVTIKELLPYAFTPEDLSS